MTSSIERLGRGIAVTSTPSYVYTAEDAARAGNPALEGQRHKGIDLRLRGGAGAVIPSPFGEPVRIVRTRESESLGYQVVIEPLSGDWPPMVLAHLDGLDGIEAGRVVAPGDPLGRQGNSGHSTGPHVHISTAGGDWGGEYGEAEMYAILARAFGGQVEARR